MSPLLPLYSIHPDFHRKHAKLQFYLLLVDVSKNVRDGERQFFFEMKEGCKVSCVKILIFP